MNYRYRPLVIIAISLVAIAIGIPRAAHADAPNPTSSLAIGDWWKYNVETPIAGLILTGTQTQTITFEANSTTTLWAVRQTGSGTLAGSRITGQWTESGWGHFRKTDMAEVDSRATLNMTLVGAVATATIYFTFISYNTPPVLTYQFPLTTGSHWTMTGGNANIIVQYYYSFDPTRHTSMSTNSTDGVYNILASPLTTVSAGTFESYQIRHRSPDGSYTDNYYSPQVENVVKQVGYAANGTQLSSMSLADYSAWSYKSTIGISQNGKDYTAIIGTDVSAYNIHQDSLSIIFQVTGTDGVTGLASIWIPVQANNTDIKVYVDAFAASLTISQNHTDYQIRFTYPLSTHTITVTYATRQQSSFLQRYMLPIEIAAVGILVMVLVAIFLVVRRKPAKPQPWDQPSANPPTPSPWVPPPSPPTQP
jgi:hypothetical protein